MIQTLTPRQAIIGVRRQAKAATLSMLAAAAIYTLILLVDPGWPTYWISMPAYVLLFITALARANDIGGDKTGVRWQVRRFCLVAVACSVVAVAFQPWVNNRFPSWAGVVLLWGFTGTWMTTPLMPPFWKWILKIEERYAGRPVKKDPPA